MGYDNYGFSSEGKHGSASYPSADVGREGAKWTCCQITFLVLGALSSILGLAMLVGGYQAMFDSILHAQMQITPGSTAYDIWRLTPIPLYLNVYFFNITNAEEFTNGGKPILQEVGPYSYREYHEKQNLTFHPNNTVTYYQQRWWIWDEEASGDNHPDDVIISLNAIPVSAAWSVHGNDIPHLIIQSFLNEAFDIVGETLISNATAGQTLFDGYSDDLLDAMFHLNLNNTIISNIIDQLPSGLTDYDKFGWFYKRNLSLEYDGMFSMFTGEDTLDNMGKIDLWNRRRETDFFDPPCNNVSGSAGELWPPNVQRDYIQFYSSDLCMSMTLFYKEDTVDENGIPVYRFWGSNETFDSSVVADDDSCYCVDNTCAPMVGHFRATPRVQGLDRYSVDPLSLESLQQELSTFLGLLNAESCRMGSPAFISFPHFFNANPSLLDEVEGLHPDPEKHSFHIDLIPELGTPTSVAARMQINMHVIPYSKINILKDVKEVYLPMMWFEVIAGLPPDMAGPLMVLLFLMKTPTMTIIWSLLLALGLLSICIVLFVHWKQSKKSRLV